VTDEGYGKFIMNFTDEKRTQYAVVGPTTTTSDTDWQATSFALSSRCAPIPATACSIDINQVSVAENRSTNTPFNCSIARGSPIDFSGITQGNPLRWAFFDFHQYLNDGGTAFVNTSLVFKSPDSWKPRMWNATEQEATQMFPSTWRWTASVSLGISSNTPESMRDIVWPLSSGPTMVVACNSTSKSPPFGIY
jgi:hypothetical protein